MKKTYFILAYNISEKNRLQSLQRLLSNQFLQLQYSLYYGSMTTKRMDSFIIAMQRVIHPNEDDLRIYEVEPLEKSFVIGKRDDDIMLFSDIREMTL
ncbi:CRISPR-associated endonuclease Cas2 [Psychrobacter luti]|uniref:CRISPR-associated endoribonuclease Cas2 n=1 Tax=Psychrobacter luti TaxID=198481 RepID=A0A839TDK7_9GAMM|nr:CRISPR-associated endonuclease Cas2 [Psychrobacter luti]MBB3106144.1 CRISPR-associated endonuclease Cas2 [Psychrobacter luti]